jgi:hypothetical protein
MSRTSEPDGRIRTAFADLRAVSPPMDSADRLMRRVASTNQTATARPAFRVLALAAAVALIGGVLVAGSGYRLIAPPEPGPAVSAPAMSPSMTSDASATVEPTKEPTSLELGPGTLARATRDVQIASIVTVLAGQTVYLVAGPVDHGGSPSFRLQVFGDVDDGYRPAGAFGWITAADAVDALIARNPVCPRTMPSGIADVAAIQPHERMLCFGERELTFGPVTASTAQFGPGLPDRVLSADSNEDFLTSLPYLRGPGVPEIAEGTWVTVTGHFNDASSSACGDADQVVLCREQFHVTSATRETQPEFVLAGTWRPTRLPPIDGRSGHRMVWTGSEAVIWGGSSSSRTQSVFDGILPKGGAAYDPSTDRWRLVSDAPIAGRLEPVVVWSGTEVIAFGGWIGDATQLDGAAWDPRTDAWRTIARSPLIGTEPVGAWLDGRLYVLTSESAAAYDPSTDRWTTLLPSPIRTGWRTATVASGRLFAVAFGDGATPPVEWGVFDPGTGTWRHGTVPIDPLMAGIGSIGAGEQVVFDNGLTFDLVHEDWHERQACQGTGAGAVWTGRVLLGVTAMWDPGTGECKDLPPSPPREPPFEDFNGREFPVAVWTGTQYITWSGGNGGDIVWIPKDGAVFTPRDDLGPCCG